MPNLVPNAVIVLQDQSLEVTRTLQLEPVTRPQEEPVFRVIRRQRVPQHAYQSSHPQLGALLDLHA